jgi:hypothetical protein
MIRSWGTVPAFKSALRETQLGGKQSSYYWRRRGTKDIAVYFQGKVFAIADSTVGAMFMARDHAIRMGLYFEAPLPEHYFRFDSDKKEWVLYVGGRFNKKGKSKPELEEYIKISAWMGAGDHGKEWVKK